MTVTKGRRRELPVQRCPECGRKPQRHKGWCNTGYRERHRRNADGEVRTEPAAVYPVSTTEHQNGKR